MKSLLYDQAPKTSERTQLGEHTTVVSELPNAFVPKHVVEFFFWLAHFDENVGQMWQLLGGLQDQARHSRPHDAVGHSAQLRRSWFVTSSGIAPGDQLQRWERKDRITRRAIAGLVRQRWPAQEALEKALADTNTDWTVVKGAEVKGIHTDMEVADQGLELGKGVGRSKGGDRDHRWRGKIPDHAERKRGPVRFPTNNDKGGWNDQSRAQGPGDKPQKRQRRIGNPSSFTPSGKKLCGAFNFAKGCPDERNCPQRGVTPLQHGHVV